MSVSQAQECVLKYSQCLEDLNETSISPLFCKIKIMVPFLLGLSGEAWNGKIIREETCVQVKKTTTQKDRPNQLFGYGPPPFRYSWWILRQAGKVTWALGVHSIFILSLTCLGKFSNSWFLPL